MIMTIDNSEVFIDMMAKRSYTREPIIDGFDSVWRAPNDARIGVIHFNTFKTIDIQTVVDRLDANDIVRAIVIYENMITTTRNVVETMTPPRFEMFSSNELEYNPTKHCFQPSFTKAMAHELSNITQTTGTRFGKMLESDPIARFYWFRAGDVVRITRTTGIYYRNVVA
jgi:DNA-directed RNA polymerase subunit H (RpoH/RPB5)